MQIQTDDLGAKKSPREGGSGSMNGSDHSEEEKRKEGAVGAAADKGVDQAKQLNTSATDTQPAHLSSDSYAQIEFSNGHMLQVKSRKGLCMAIKRNN